MVKLKSIPEDFIVTEIFSPKISDDGPYSIFLLEKKDYSTLKAIQLISNALGVKSNNIGYSGTKDKVAVTRQYISIKFLGESMRQDFSRKDIGLRYLGQSNDVISLGMHSSNRFDIILRDIDTEKRISQIPDFFVNYFDEQRFSKNNVEIGLMILRGDFKNAILKILEFYCDDKEILSKIDSGRLNEISFGDREDIEIARSIIDYLSKRRNDFVGAMKIIPKKILQIYVKSLQSEIFNRSISEYIQMKLAVLDIEINKDDMLERLYIPQDISQYDGLDVSVPVVGFSTNFSNDDLSRIIQKILQNLGLTQRSFIVRQLPDLSEEGTERRMITSAKDIKISDLSVDEFNSGRNKVALSFGLDPGAYATIFIKHITKYNNL